MPVLTDPEEDQPAPKKKRGGRRPGAGAPKGNLNALKHGRRSAQFAQLGALLASLPQTRNALLNLAQRHQLKERRAEEVAALLLTGVLQRALQIRNARLNPPPPIDERRSIEKTGADEPSPGYPGRPQAKNFTPDQSDSQPGPAPSIDP